MLKGRQWIGVCFFGMLFVLGVFTRYKAANPETPVLNNGTEVAAGATYIADKKIADIDGLIITAYSADVHDKTTFTFENGTGEEVHAVMVSCKVNTKIECDNFDSCDIKMKPGETASMEFVLGDNVEKTLAGDNVRNMAPSFELTATKTFVTDPYKIKTKQN